MSLHLKTPWAVLALVAVTSLSPAWADAQSDRAASMTAETVLEAFHRALREGDGQSALQWLSEDAIILEGGTAQTVEEYKSHHLGSDMAFLSKMEEELLSRRTLHSDGTMIIITRTQLTGDYKDTEIDTLSSETAVLARTDAGWRIRHLHWSSTSN